MDRRQSLKQLRDLIVNPDQNNASSSKDLLFKMSKKIAQLTKVVYFLNTRNEECELKLKILKLSHEEDINTIEKKDGAIMAELSEKVAEALQMSELQDSVIKVYFNLIHSTI
jgi:hypothetical protein